MATETIEVGDVVRLLEPQYLHGGFDIPVGSLLRVYGISGDSNLLDCDWAGENVMYEVWVRPEKVELYGKAEPGQIYQR